MLCGILIIGGLLIMMGSCLHGFKRKASQEPMLWRLYVLVKSHLSRQLDPAALVGIAVQRYVVRTKNATTPSAGSNACL